MSFLGKSEKGKKKKRKCFRPYFPFVMFFSQKTNRFRHRFPPPKIQAKRTIVISCFNAGTESSPLPVGFKFGEPH